MSDTTYRSLYVILLISTFTSVAFILFYAVNAYFGPLFFVLSAILLLQFFFFWYLSKLAFDEQKNRLFSDAKVPLEDFQVNKMANYLERDRVLDALDLLINASRNSNDEVYNYLVVEKSRLNRKLKDLENKDITLEKYRKIEQKVNSVMFEIVQYNAPNKALEKFRTVYNIISKADTAS